MSAKSGGRRARVSVAAPNAAPILPTRAGSGTARDQDIELSANPAVDFRGVIHEKKNQRRGQEQQGQDPLGPSLGPASRVRRWRDIAVIRRTGRRHTRSPPKQGGHASVTVPDKHGDGSARYGREQGTAAAGSESHRTQRSSAGPISSKKGAPDRDGLSRSGYASTGPGSPARSARHPRRGTSDPNSGEAKSNCSARGGAAPGSSLPGRRCSSHRPADDIEAPAQP